MGTTLKPGDRVRVTARNRMDSYQPGDTGTVTSGPHVYPSGTVYFHITMDVQPLAPAIIFLDDEIELDV
jgi:hypothetical protein